MSFGQWLSSRFPVVDTRPERHGSLEAPARAVTDCPPEYVPLHNYLRDRYASLVVLTFEQIESLLGFALPDAARTEGSWWTRAERHTGAWAQAQRSAAPNLPARHVAFERLP